MSDVPSPAAKLRSDSFSFPHPTLFCPRVHLYEDRLELTGWRLWKRYCRRIPLGEILHADAVGATDLLLWIADGKTLRLEIDNAQQWQRTINRRLDDNAIRRGGSPE